MPSRSMWKPFHCHRLFGDFEVALLNTSHRIQDPDTLEFVTKMRDRRMTPPDAERIRRLCDAFYNRERAEQYARDFSIFHLVTTNREVDEVNGQYITDFARARHVKIGIVRPKSGTPLAFAEGARMCVLKNVRKDRGITNGLFCVSAGALFANYSNDTLTPTDKSICMLIVPDEADGRSLATGWADELEPILRSCNEAIRNDRRPLTDDEIRLHKTRAERGRADL